MQYIKAKLIAILLLGLGLTAVHAQETIPTTGGNSTGSGGSASYSVGQIVYTTNTGTNGSVAQGVQQPFEISVVTGIEEAKGITLQCTVWPNPATDLLILKVENYNNVNLSFQLFDINGKLLETKINDGNETNFDLRNLMSGTYFLKVIQSQKEIKTFKIIKK